MRDGFPGDSRAYFYNVLAPYPSFCLCLPRIDLRRRSGLRTVTSRPSSVLVLLLLVSSLCASAVLRLSFSFLFPVDG